MNALFRSEVLQQRQHRLMSGVSLVQPTPWRWLAGSALAMATIVAALLIFGDYTQRIRVTGVLNMSPASGPIEAHIEVPSTAIALVHPGDAILLRYPAFPYQKFGQQQGIVARVSPAPVVNRNGRNEDFNVVLRLPRTSVQVADRAVPLQPGQRVEAELLGERRAIWKWLFKPLRTLHAEQSL